MEVVRVVLDTDNNKVVVIPEIIFKNKQNIAWDEVEKYLRKYVGEVVEVEGSKKLIYIGNVLPDEYTSSKYTRSLKGARSKAKANATQGIKEMVRIASEEVHRENKKKKHCNSAANGWYYYTTRFAIPTYNNKLTLEGYSVYSGCLVVQVHANNRLYLYDLVNIKKETSNPLQIINNQVVQNPFL
ncbi:MAG: hypothetical protein R3Y58_09455 [Eubacteriales bacterium]